MNKEILCSTTMRSDFGALVRVSTSPGSIAKNPSRHAHFANGSAHFMELPQRVFEYPEYHLMTRFPWSLTSRADPIPGCS